MKILSDFIMQNLLGKGYFPKEMPSVFTTIEFGREANSILDDWEKSGVFKIRNGSDFPKVQGVKFRGKKGFKKVPTAEPETISKPKGLYERRNVHITHPVPQALLAREIAANWQIVQKWLSRQTFSEDEIVVSGAYDRAIKGINFPMHRAKVSFIEATSDWLVKTDITRFYPSIYTHSLGWAAYGKDNVKENIKSYEGSLADRLDILVRSCNRNQTVGIPIGPETSRILAEVVSSRIDSDFLEKISNGDAKFKDIALRSVDRLQDDWVVGVPSLERAEHILSLIVRCYREYGLEINGSKTSVTHSMKSSGVIWKSEIASFLSHRRGPLIGVRLKEFLALCIRLQLQTPGDPVLNYALSIIEGHRFRAEDIEEVEAFLLKAASVAPNSLDRICRIILNINHSTGCFSKRRIADRFITLAERHIENGSLFEVIWLLYTVRGLKQPFVAKRVVDLSEDVQSSALRLLLLEMGDLELCIRPLPKGAWEADISADRVLTDWTWLYAYEAVRKGWLSGPAGILNSPLFKPMHVRNVTFYDPDRNVMRSEKVKKYAAKNRKADYIQAARLINTLRGFERFLDLGAEY
ncbi:MAG: hypothetical protein CMM50_13030 [Rhodospirillaceae bacterium]|nr:hypothetical protein [Rhodospirillaceae bacterium]|tara:strand:+ start:872 stop:2611 length:1740 start_codon:yes stop_codon:yes gene_type:complete